MSIRDIAAELDVGSMAVESILHKTLKPALGCTEAVAISLGVAATVMATEGWSP